MERPNERMGELLRRTGGRLGGGGRSRLRRRLDQPGQDSQVSRTARRALEALIVLIFVLVVSSLMLVPGQSTILSGAELLGAGLLAWIWLITLAASAFRRLDPRYRTTWILRITLSQFATLPIIIAGVVTLPQGTANF